MTLTGGILLYFIFIENSFVVSSSIYTMDDKEKLGAISIEIGIVDDRLDSFEKEGIEFLEALKEEWKVLYHIREILEK